jgi:hypothetical protein
LSAAGAFVHHQDTAATRIKTELQPASEEAATVKEEAEISRHWKSNRRLSPRGVILSVTKRSTFVRHQRRNSVVDRKE